MKTEIDRPISKEELDWVRSKHQGIYKTGRRMLKDALELGQWFIEAAERMGLESHSKKGTRGGTWRLWLGATFPEIHSRVVSRYMRLARDKEYLTEQLSLDNGDTSERDPPSITRALGLLTQRDREVSEQAEPAPVAVTEPLLILRDQLKEYVYTQFHLEFLKAQIQVRIKSAKLGRRQIRQAVQWATEQHPEIREMVLKAFL